MDNVKSLNVKPSVIKLDPNTTAEDAFKKLQAEFQAKQKAFMEGRQGLTQRLNDVLNAKNNCLGQQINQFGAIMHDVAKLVLTNAGPAYELAALELALDVGRNYAELMHVKLEAKKDAVMQSKEYQELEQIEAETRAELDSLLSSVKQSEAQLQEAANSAASGHQFSDLNAVSSAAVKGGELN